MKHSLGRLSIAGLFLVVIPMAAWGQAQPVELGIDFLGLSADFNGRTVTTVSIPNQTFRAGFFTGDAVSIEPAVTIVFLDVEGAPSVLTMDLGLGALVHFGTKPNGAGGYVRPFGGLTLIMADDETASQFNAGAGLGGKFPVIGRLFVRVEGFFSHRFESTDFAERNRVGATLGFSFLTR